MQGAFLTGRSKLEKVIEDLRKDLMAYSEKPGASEKFMNKQNAIIKNLVESFNDLETLRFYETWELIEQEMAALERIDPELNAHTILIQTRPGKTKCSRIVINPFEND